MGLKIKIAKRFIVLKVRELGFLLMMALLIGGLVAVFAPLLVFLLNAPGYIYLTCSGLDIPCSIWHCFLPFTMDKVSIAMLDPMNSLVAGSIYGALWIFIIYFGVRSAIVSNWKKATQQVFQELEIK